MDPKEYLVTKLAGPKVAGRPVQPGDKVTLTETQARAERLSGAIVLADGKADPDDPLAGSKKLEAIRARARGLSGPGEQDDGGDGPEDPPPAPPRRSKAAPPAPADIPADPAAAAAA